MVREAEAAPGMRDSLRIGFEAPAQVRAGEPVAFAITVENGGSAPIDLYLRGREIAYDVVVTTEDGRVLWRRLEGELIPAILRIEALAPGEVLRLEARWDQRTRAGELVPEGIYHARGEVLTEDPEPLVTPRRIFRIVAN